MGKGNRKPFQIRLTIDQDVMENLKDEMTVKRITKNIFGTCDEFILLVLGGWRERKSELHIELKKKEKGKCPIEAK